jgi:hypothetical protein
MVLILLSLILTVTMIVVAISRRHRISSSSLIRVGIAEEGFTSKSEDPGRSSLRPPKSFLVVVLPDGTIVARRMVGGV